MIQKVPFVDFSYIHRPIRNEAMKIMSEIMDQGSFILGGEVSAFEAEFAKWNGARHCVGLASGLDALTLAFKALGIGPGDEVIVPTHTFIASVLAITHVGARPILVDVAKDSGIEIDQVESKITSRTKAILPVHLYGLPVKMPELMSLARKYSLRVVEDSAQAHGAAVAEKKCGTFGEMGCFSFYPTKNLGAMGDAGAVITDDPDLAHRIACLRNVGQVEKNDHQVIGFNSRLDSFQAAILRLKLPHLNEHNQMRREAAKIYKEQLASVQQIQVPVSDENRTEVFHLFVIRTENEEAREKLKKHLLASGIGCAVHYPRPVHLQPCYKSLGHQVGDFPEAEKICSTSLSLPMFAGITRDQIDLVCRTIAEHFS